MNPMQTHFRDLTCGDARREHIGRRLSLAGWVHRRRYLGQLIFLDLRDRYGITQVVVDAQEAPHAHAAAATVRNEFVVCVEGMLAARLAGTENPKLATGEVELRAAEVTILSTARTPAFPINEPDQEADEAVRLRFRYLDLRREPMLRRILARSRLVEEIRRVHHAHGFVEIETPMLIKSTPEGARDFIVPSRLQPGSVYALPQSPQQLKQLLMVGGIERYFQIARCFRDEDLRGDRQPEFTQLDLEMSFVAEEDVMAFVEAMVIEVSRAVVPERPIQHVPFPRLTHREALDRFGSDKPDLRYGMELVDLSSVFSGTGFRSFASVLGSGGVVRAIAAPGGAQLSRKELDELVIETKGRGAAGLVWIAFSGGEARSPVEKHLTPEEIDGVRAATGAGDGDLVLVVADKADRVAVALDGLRRTMAARLGLIPEGAWAFVWLTEPPLFEWSEEENKWVSVHHLFTSPVGDDLNPETASSRGYDLVLNGFELGGGSIRIHRPELQREVFRILGLTDEEAEEKFGHMLNAFRYGVPPHGGIAFGLDRIVMLLAGKEAIRDVIAFPKTQSGADPLTGAPAPVSDVQLRELGIQMRVQPQAKEEA